jgi:radical SAM protein with 4Fe4S-binding SPASM domain
MKDNPKLPADLAIISERDNHILLHPNRPIWTVVNNTGLMIAKLLDGTKSIDEIAELLSRKFNIDRKTALDDVNKFIEHLTKTGLFQDSSLKFDKPVGFSKMDLYITEKCNLRCIHCAIMDDSRKKDYLTLEKIKDLVDQYKELGGKVINLIGGEPLIREDIKEIIDYAARKIDVILPTNAVLIDDNIAEFLSRYDKLAIQISMDGGSSKVHDKIRGKGTFNKVMKAVESLRKYNALEKSCFSFVVMKTNIGEVKSVIELTERLGLPEVRFTLIHKAGYAEKDWLNLNAKPDEYVQIYKYLYEELLNDKRKIKIVPGLEGFYLFFKDKKQEDMWCNVGRTFCIDYAGNVFPCSLFKLEELSVGNVFKSSLKEIASSKKFIDFKMTCKERKRQIDECKNCPFVNFCQAGCPARSYALYGDMYKVDFMCEFKKELFKKMILECSATKLEILKSDDLV